MLWQPMDNSTSQHIISKARFTDYLRADELKIMLFPESAGPRLCDKDVKITDPPPPGRFSTLSHTCQLLGAGF